MKIGVIIDSFRKDFRSSIEAAREVGADGVQIGAKFLVGKEDELAGHSSGPEIVSISEAKKILDANGVKPSAICGDFGHGFMDPEQNKIYVEKSKRVLDLAKKLECNVVTRRSAEPGPWTGAP